MKTKPWLLLWAVAPLFAGLLQAQVPSTGGTPDQPPPQPPPPGYPYPTYPYGDSTGPGARWAADITFPYAFNFDAAGISGELGGLVGHNFFGGEVTYYGSTDQRYTVFDNSGNEVGHFRSDQNITTVEFAYRYFVPLFRENGWAPAALYFGAGGGVGFVDFSNDGSQFGFHNDNSGEPAGEVVGGVQVRAGRNLSLRLGYRYVDISRVWQFDHRADMDSNVVEAGFAFRF